ncbi:MAG: hypothetical protein U9Q98_03565, partial [Bacteroidota bacterium]|nr:hypothetical protein [Bacteroidota bacterium]
MKKGILLLLSLCIFSVIAISQVYVPGYEGDLPGKNVDKLEISTPDKSKALEEADYLDNKPGPYMVSKIIDVDISMENAGTWDILNDGASVWRLELHLPGAEAVNILYDTFLLPEGSYLCLYNANKKQLTDPYTSSHNTKPGKHTSTEIIEGETVFIEYVQPAGVSGEPQLQISGLSWFYRGVDALVGAYRNERPTGFGDSGDCNVNVNCAEGANWQEEKHSVALIYIPTGMGGGFCSGSLINNTA